MKGIILAGGSGTRLQPLTLVTNKHLLPIGNKPMIMHSLFKLTSSGINEIMIVTGPEYIGAMVKLLGSGNKFNCNISYRIQDNPDGIGGALKQCKNFAGTDDVVVILGDNIFKNSLSKSINKFKKIKKTSNLPVCLLNLKKVNDPHRFGIATIENKKIVNLVEKPAKPKSDLCVTGIYIYDNFVFTAVENIKISSRGEYEITEVNNFYVKEGVAEYNILDGWWIDAGTFASYHKANEMINSDY